MRRALGAALALVLLCAGTADAKNKTEVRSTISAPAVVPAACDAIVAASFPSLVVDPRDANRMTSVWLTGGIVGTASATSADGGRTWQRTPVPGASECAGDAPGKEVQLNPRMAVGPTGGVWFGSTWAGPDGSRTAVHRAPAGAAFQPGVDLAPEVQGQSVAVVPDAKDPDAALALWSQFDVLGPLPVRASVVVQRTSDGGRTWSEPATALAPLDGYATEAFAERLPDGTIVALTSTVRAADLPGAVVAPESVPVRVEVARSADDGQTWSSPQVIGEFRIESLPDPEGRYPPGASESFGIAAIIKPDLAASPSGELSAAWAVLTPSGGGEVHVARSSDSGRTWSAAQPLVRSNAPVFSPHVAYDGKGQLGIFYYDWSEDVLGDVPLTTVARIAVPSAHATVTLPSTFDLRSAYRDVEYDGGQALGVTQDLRGLPKGGFASAYTVAPPQSTGPTEVRLATVVGKSQRPRRASGPRLSSATLSVRGRTAFGRLACDGPSPCRGKIQLAGSRRGASFSLKPRASRRLALTVPRGILRKLRRQRVVRWELRLRAEVAGGMEHLRIPVTLKRRPK